MASAQLIQQLLQQEFARKNQPSGFDQNLARTMQIMQGVAQGIQMFDAIKSLPGKFGTLATTSTMPGASGVPTGQPSNVPDVTSLLPSLLGATSGVGRNTASQMPSFAPGASTLFPAPQAGGTTAIPARTVTTPGMPGSQALDAISKLKGFTGTESIMNSILKPFGLENSGIAPEPTSIWDPIQKTWTQAPAGKIKIGSSAPGAGLELQAQRLQLSKDQFEQSIKEFNTTQSRLSDQAERSRLTNLADPFVKAIADPKYKDDKDAVDFANSAIEEINRTGQLPATKWKRAEAFGFEVGDFLDTDIGGKKVVDKKGGADLRAKATKYLQDRKKPVTDSNIQAIIDKGLVK